MQFQGPLIVLDLAYVDMYLYHRYLLQDYYISFFRGVVKLQYLSLYLIFLSVVLPNVAYKPPLLLIYIVFDEMSIENKYK